MELMGELLLIALSVAGFVGVFVVAWALVFGAIAWVGRALGSGAAETTEVQAAPALTVAALASQHHCVACGAPVARQTPPLQAILEIEDRIAADTWAIARLLQKPERESCRRLYID